MIFYKLKNDDDVNIIANEILKLPWKMKKINENEIDDSNNKIDRTLIDEVKQIVDKSWNKFHNSDKIAFFEKHKTYFKESIDEFKNIRCK